MARLLVLDPIGERRIEARVLGSDELGHVPVDRLPHRRRFAKHGREERELSSGAGTREPFVSVPSPPDRALVLATRTGVEADQGNSYG